MKATIRSDMATGAELRAQLDAAIAGTAQDLADEITKRIQAAETTSGKTLSVPYRESTKKRRRRLGLQTAKMDLRVTGQLRETTKAVVRRKGERRYGVRIEGPRAHVLIMLQGRKQQGDGPKLKKFKIFALHKRQKQLVSKRADERIAGALVAKREELIRYS